MVSYAQTIHEKEAQTMTNADLWRRLDAGNPHTWFDEGDVASAATPRRELLLCKIPLTKVASALMLASTVCMAGVVLAETVTYDLSRQYAPYLTSTETTIWENRNLADIEAFTCTMNGGWIGSDTVGIGVIYDRTSTSFTVQFQCVNGGCKAVRAYFRQDGANIVARADKAGRDATESHYGMRLEDSLFTTQLATSDSAGGYGVKLIDAFGDVVQTIDALPADADAIVVNGGVLQVNVSGDTTVSAPISGTGGFRFHGSGVVVETQHTFDQYVTGSSQTLIENTDIFDIEITSAVFNGGWCGRGEGAKPYNVTVTSNVESKTMRVQLQNRFGDWNNLYGFIVELSQSGNDVLIKGISTRKGSSGKEEGSDMAEWTSDSVSIATSATAGGYGLESISFVRRSLPTVILSGTKSWTGGTIADGCKVKVTTSQLAANTMARAVSGGVLELAAAGTWNSTAQNTFIAETNSTVFFRQHWTINQKDRLNVLGGAVKYDADAFVYVNNALFSDGATWSGSIAQVGYQNNCYWRTEGEEDIDIFAKLSLASNSGAAREITLDTAADIVFHEGFAENTSNRGATLVKQGTAKANFVTGGTITGSLRLEGGTVAFGGNAGFGALVVAGDSAVEVASGKTLSFASSADKEWAAGVQLNFTGAFDSTNHVVRFGTNATGLTAAQLKKIRVNGERCKLDESGWLHPYTGGLIISFR